MNPAHAELSLMLEDLYQDPDEARQVAVRVGLNPARINLAGAPRIFCMRIVDEAAKQGKISALIRVVRDDFPNLAQALENIEKRLARPQDVQPPRDEPRVEPGQWKGPDKVSEGLEKVMGQAVVNWLDWKRG